VWLLDWRAVLAAAAVIAGCGAAVAAELVRPGPLFPAAARGRPGYALAMFAQRGPRLVNLGYFGHMWELYALWTWLPAYLAASTGPASTAAAVGRAAAGAVAPAAVGSAAVGSAAVGSAAASASATSLEAFLAIGVAGAAGCLIGGWAAMRFGRPATAAAALASSGACCLASPLSFTASRPWLLAFAAVWGAAVIADSGVFSALLSELADRRYLGTALTAQTAIGFGLTIVTIQLVPLIAEAVGWRYALLILAVGPLAGLRAVIRITERTSP
jgi:hypothetical protein